MNRTAQGSHQEQRTSMAWWGHLIVLTLILGSTATSVVTGNPLYAVILVPVAWYIGTRLSRAPQQVVAVSFETADIQVVSTAGQSYIVSEDGSRARVESL